MAYFRIGWYLLYTRHKYERKVAESLDKNSIRNFLPMISSLRKIGDRSKVVLSPFFPSYIFIFLENTRTYFAGLATDGVLRYVRFGKEVARVGDRIIADLELICRYGNNVVVTSEPFKEGQVLTIMEGSFAGLTCEMINYKNKQKILVRINLLQRNIILELGIAQVLK